MLEFDATIPENVQKSLSNGTIRIQLDVDKSQAHIIPDLISGVGDMYHIVMVTHDEASKIADSKQKDRHASLVSKVHVLWGEAGKKYGKSLNEYKAYYKEKNNISVSTKDLDDDSLIDICEKLQLIIDNK